MKKKDNPKIGESKSRINNAMEIFPQVTPGKNTYVPSMKFGSTQARAGGKKFKFENIATRKLKMSEKISITISNDECSISVTRYGIKAKFKPDGEMEHLLSALKGKIMSQFNRLQYKEKP